MALYEEIGNQIDDVQTSIDDIVDDAQGLIDSIQSELDRIDINYKLDYSTVGNIPDLDAIETADGKPGDWMDDLDELKAYFDIDPDSIAKPVLSQLPDIAQQQFVEPDAAPAINYGSAPTAFNEAVPTSPTLTTVTLPEKPDTDLPVAPSFSTITIPETPEFTSVETFAGVRPDDLDDATLTIREPCILGNVFRREVKP